MKRFFIAVACLGLSLAPAAADARPGDLSEPFRVASFPFVHATTTIGRASAVGRYSCATQLSEVGPEVVYTLTATRAGVLTASVVGDADPVDIDVQILSSLALTGDTASGCLARGNRSAKADVAGAGTLFVVVDTFESSSRAGPYRLRIDFQPIDDWYTRPIARGVRLRTKVYASLFGGPQNASVLEVDLADPAVTVKPITQNLCVRTSVLGDDAGAVAAINGGFFSPGGTCASVSLLKIDGRFLAANAVGRTAFGVDALEQPSLRFVAAGQNWPEAQQAVGGVPRIVTAGAIDVRGVEEGADPSFVTSRHPRTAAGITPAGTLQLATIDGRTAAGAGMSLAELAQWMIWLGSSEALNLDGGGSTTLWARGEPFGGVVNYPSDLGRTDHTGERAVGNALGVFAPPLDGEAVWLVPAPSHAAFEGRPWSFEIAAADPEGGALAFVAGAGALDGPWSLQDRADGTATFSFTPTAIDAARSPLALEIIATVAASRSSTLAVAIQVIPAIAPDAGANADSGARDAGSTEASTDAGEPDDGAAPDAAPASRDASPGFEIEVTGVRIETDPPECGCRGVSNERGSALALLPISLWWWHARRRRRSRGDC